MDFDIHKFIDTLQRSQSLNSRQRNDLIRAARAACGSALDIRAGDVFKSSRGVRLVTEVMPGLFTLVSLKAFEGPCAELVGHKVSDANRTLEDLEQYVYSHGYTKIGRIDTLNLANVQS